MMDRSRDQPDLDVQFRGQEATERRTSALADNARPDDDWPPDGVIRSASDVLRWKNALLMAPNLNPSEKVVGLAVGYHYNVKTGLCFPSQELLARELRVTTRTVNKRLGRVAKCGWIRIVRPSRHLSNSYVLLNTHMRAVEERNSTIRMQLNEEREHKRRAPRRAL